MSTSRPTRSGKLRALLSLGMLLGIAQVGTLAAWTDSATITTGGFTTGTLDLQVGAESADQLAGQGGTWTHGGLTLTEAMPGESVAQTMTIGNAGSVPLTLAGSAAVADAALADADGAGLLITVVLGGEPVNAGSQTGGDRLGECVGGEVLVADAPLTTSGTNLGIDGIRLASGEETSVCVIVELSVDAPNAMQGASTTVVITVGGEQ